MAHCGAKTRSGEPCKRHAVPGSSKCKLHGGAASKANKGNKHAAKAGSIYSKFLTDAENDMLASIELGKVDDELRLTRIRLMRALDRENEFGNELEVDSENLETGEHGGTTTTSKVRDYSSLIDRLSGKCEYSLNQDFVEAKVDPQVISELLKAVQAGQFPASDFWLEMRRVGLIKAEKTDEDIRGELETSTTGLGLGGE